MPSTDRAGEGIELSFAHLSGVPLPTDEYVRAAAAAGVGTVGLRLQPMRQGEATTDIVRDRGARRRVERALADTGLRVHDVEVMALAPQRRAADYAAFLDVAAELRVSRVNVQTPGAAGSEAVDLLGEAQQEAAQRGIICSFEFVSWLAVPSLGEALALLDQVGGDFEVVPDLLHLHRTGGGIDDLLVLPERRMTWLQLTDVAPGATPEVEEQIRQARHERVTPGEGVLDIRRLLAEVRRPMTVSLEVPNDVLVERIGAAEHMRRLVEAARALIALGVEPRTPVP